MPSLYTTPELLTSIIYPVVVILVVYRSRQAVAKHAFCEGREGVDRILLEEACCGGGVTLGRWDFWIDWGSKLEEFVLGF